jgi:hypothetical protein
MELQRLDEGQGYTRITQIDIMLLRYYARGSR